MKKIVVPAVASGIGLLAIVSPAPADYLEAFITTSPLGVTAG